MHKNSKKLDCETEESTYCSLRDILNLDIDYIKGKLNRFNALGCSNDIVYPKETLFRFFDIDESRVNFDLTYWFHLTRAPTGSTFQEGIRNLGEQIDEIWAFLYSLLEKDTFPDYKWLHFRRMLEGDDYQNDYANHYRTKTKDQFHWGPYGILIRDTAFVADDIGNYDYLQSPEIIEDICICFEDIYHIDLMSAFKKATKPCIVKFHSANAHISDVKRALYYLYLCYHSLPFARSCSICFDGHSTSITKNQIEKIEFLTDSIP